MRKILSLALLLTALPAAAQTPQALLGTWALDGYVGDDGATVPSDPDGPTQLVFTDAQVDMVWASDDFITLRGDSLAVTAPDGPIVVGYAVTGDTLVVGSPEGEPPAVFTRVAAGGQGLVGAWFFGGDESGMGIEQTLTVGADGTVVVRRTLPLPLRVEGETLVMGPPESESRTGFTLDGDTLLVRDRVLPGAMRFRRTAK